MGVVSFGGGVGGSMGGCTLPMTWDIVGFVGAQLGEGIGRVQKPVIGGSKKSSRLESELLVVLRCSIDGAEVVSGNL